MWRLIPLLITMSLPGWRKLHSPCPSISAGKVHLELVSEATTAYYSGMVPAAVAGLYRDEECLVRKL